MKFKDVALILASQLTLNSMPTKSYSVSDNIFNILKVEKKQEKSGNASENNKSINFYDVMKNSEINNKVKEIHKNSKNKETFNEKDIFILILIILTISSLFKICRNTGDKNKNNNKIDIDDAEDLYTTDTNEKCKNNKFSLNRLDDLIKAGENYKGFSYLEKYLEKIGSGFSRSVYSYGDTRVIKYERNHGCYEPSQNIVELHCYQNLKSPILPNIYKRGKDAIYLICEQVEQIQQGDFQKILGMPFGDDRIDVKEITSVKSKDFDKEEKMGANDIKSMCLKGCTIKNFILFMEYMYSQKTKTQIPNHIGLSLEELELYTERKEKVKNMSKNFFSNIDKSEIELYENLAEHHTRFKELARYIEYVISTYDIDYCDFRIWNFGVVERNGEQFICILDSGRSGPIGSLY